MTNHLSIKRVLIMASLTMSPWIPLLPGQAADQLPAIAAVAPAQVTWVGEIRNSLDLYKKTYPASDFAPYFKKLNLVEDALGHGDGRSVRIEMGAFFKMLATRAYGISEIAADELSNFAEMTMPAQEYGIIFPRNETERYVGRGREQ